MWLHPRDKLKEPDDIDRIISAEIPDKVKFPKLYALVKRFMVHGPCGALNPNAPCMENGKCTKGFPQSFQPQTIIDGDGFPKYKRPNDGRQFQVGTFWADNRYIVPFDPYLSAKYNCHINLGCAATLGSIGYVIKYMEKGPDHATLETADKGER